MTNEHEEALRLRKRLEYQLDSRTFNSQLHEDLIAFFARARPHGESVAEQEITQHVEYSQTCLRSAEAANRERDKLLSKLAAIRNETASGAYVVDRMARIREIVMDAFQPAQAVPEGCMELLREARDAIEAQLRGVWPYGRVGWDFVHRIDEALSAAPKSGEIANICPDGTAAPTGDKSG